ncbi:MAG: hypothetical protein R3B48_12840 [Kofleriaceae bacterium]
MKDVDDRWERATRAAGATGGRRGQRAGRGARWGLVACAALACGAGACARPPAERWCPPLAQGDLRVSELYAGDRAQGWEGWVEVFNATAQDVELLGLAVRLRRLDGGAEQRLLVRREVVLAGGGYGALSLSTDAGRAAFASYGLADVAPASLYPAGAVQLETCEVVVDRVRYAGLPSDGSLARGASSLGAAGGDDAGSWCEARAASAAEPPGTPGEENGPCR